MQTEEDRIKNLCISVESNKKLFWKLIKSQRSSFQKSAFLVNGNLLTDKSAIRDMWADHFEELGTPSKIQILIMISFPGLQAVPMKHWYRIVMTPAVFCTSL